MGSGQGPVFLNKAKYWADSVFSYTCKLEISQLATSFSFLLFYVLQQKKKPHFIRVERVEEQDYKDETAILFSSDVTFDRYALTQKEICKLS